MKDHLAMVSVEPQDKVDYGVRGMKWGVRRSSSQLKVAAVKRDVAVRPIIPVAKKSVDDDPESSTQRYARLQAQGKAGKAKDMSDVDLKFFNARTEAVAKVNKLNETQPGWLAATAKKTLLGTVEKELATVAAAVAGKYVSSRVIDGIKDNSKAIQAESKTPIDYIGKRRAKK